MSHSGDALNVFQLQRAGVRGVVVRLDDTWTEIRSRANVPEHVAQRLGESLTASALFSGALKFEGSLSIHLRGAGALRLMFAECTHDGHLRGVARIEDGSAEAGVDLRDPKAQLAITIENTQTDTRYQGLVAVESDTLAGAFEGYFERSEQLPTRIVLAEHNGRCAGIMLQLIAGSPGTSAPLDSDGWNRAGHLLATLSAEELLELPVETLLLRLFHEEGVLLQPARPLRFRCSCSRQRVLGMLQALGPEESVASLTEHGHMEVTCEFCNRIYRIDRVDVAGLFAGRPLAPASDQPH